jgi:SPX domain protein involved in polyphosphate accumulation
MKFGNQFTLKQNPLWVEFYLHYDEGKQMISRLKRLKLDSKPIVNLAVEIKDFLTSQLKNINDWYIKIETQCVTTQKELKEEYTNSDLYDLNQQFTIAEFSELLVSLRDFSELNALAFQKIIKKFDKVSSDEKVTKMCKEIEVSLQSQYFRTSKEVETIFTQIHV